MKTLADQHLSGGFVKDALGQDVAFIGPWVLVVRKDSWIVMQRSPPHRPVFFGSGDALKAKEALRDHIASLLTVVDALEDAS